MTTIPPPWNGKKDLSAGEIDKEIPPHGKGQWMGYPIEKKNREIKLMLTFMANKKTVSLLFPINKRLSIILETLGKKVGVFSVEKLNSPKIQVVN